MSEAGTVPSKREAIRRRRARIYPLSRGIIVLLNLLSFGTLLLWQPQSVLGWSFDILLRTHVGFLCTVMAHEGVHGLLGRSRRANYWWGRLALLPIMIPYVNFRKTHVLHHAHTNEPDKDPDHFMNITSAWQILPRSLAMPHQWFFWLRKRKRLKRADIWELVWNYAGILTVFVAVFAIGGVGRVALGMAVPLVLVSLMLWYPFAFKTHEGFSLGTPEERSHNYYGPVLFWLTLGLSMHRAHHLYPERSWLELREFVEPAPGGWWRNLVPTRDIRLPAAGS